MPLNLSTRKPRRERFPLEHDLLGIPHKASAEERAMLLQQLKPQPDFQEFEEPDMAVPVRGLTKPVTNSFTVDYQQGGAVIDINKPPKVNYNPRDPEHEYPKMLYPPNYPQAKHVLAASKEQEAELLKKKFTLKPPVSAREEAS